MTDYSGEITKTHLEFLRNQANTKFDRVRQSWIDCGKWAAPWRIKWLLSQLPGERNNQHVVDGTHILALRSYIAGFLEGNTSATRPWARFGTGNPDRDFFRGNKEWLQLFGQQIFKALSASNFYDAAATNYLDIGVINTSAYFIDELPGGKLYWHNLIPGSYKVINNSYGEAVILIREFSLNVKALVTKYGKKKDGKWDWSNFSSYVKKAYEDCNYTEMVDVVQVVQQNKEFDPDRVSGGSNRKWMSHTYELGSRDGIAFADSGSLGILDSREGEDKDKFLRISYSKRKPFIVPKNKSNGNYEYGETGPTLDALGLIKSLNKKALTKDEALEQMIRPPLQGPGTVKKSYITTAANSFIPLDAQALASKQKLEPLFQINPAIGALTADVQDLRQMVDRFFYADYLLYLSKNPKTRTATETDAIVNEQQLVIGPNLQSLNWTHNVPIMDFMMEYVLDEDPYLPPPPDDLGGTFLRPEFISVFAQAQKAADLPSVERYLAMVTNVGQINPKIWDNVNLDKLSQIYEDRLYLPSGLNRDQKDVDAIREQQQMMMERQQKLEAMTQVAGAAKDVGITAKQTTPGGQ